MRLSKSTRYALYAAYEMARAGDRLVTVGEVALRYGIAEGVLAKILQQLVRSRIAAGTRGVGGGYRLVRSPSALTVLDVIEVFDPPRPQGACMLAEGEERDCERARGCGLRRLFDEVDEVVRSTYASVTFETLARGAGGAPGRPPGGASAGVRPLPLVPRK